MSGETNLQTLIASMQPILHETPYVFCSVDRETFRQLRVEPTGTFQEAEGVTLILIQTQANELGLAYELLWACITLSVHSSLAAVGFLAAVTNQLARAGISTNPVSAYYHDHLFVPWESRLHALDELIKLSQL